MSFLSTLLSSVDSFSRRPSSVMEKLPTKRFHTWILLFICSFIHLFCCMIPFLWDSKKGKTIVIVYQILKLFLLKSTDSLLGPMNQPKAREKLGIPPSILYLSLRWAILSAVTLQSPWVPGRTRLIKDIFISRDTNTPKKQQNPYRTDHPPNNQAAPRSRGNDRLMGTRLLPWSDDSDNNFSRTLWEPGLR
jgi:hypothetical protein